MCPYPTPICANMFTLLISYYDPTCRPYSPNGIWINSIAICLCWQFTAYLLLVWLHLMLRWIYHLSAGNACCTTNRLDFIFQSRTGNRQLFQTLCANEFSNSEHHHYHRHHLCFSGHLPGASIGHLPHRISPAIYACSNTEPLQATSKLH